MSSELNEFLEAIQREYMTRSLLILLKKLGLSSARKLMKKFTRGR